MSFLDKIITSYEEKLEKEAEEAECKYTEDYYKMKREIDEERAKEAAKWTTIHRIPFPTFSITASPSPVIGGSPPVTWGISPSGHAWVEEVALSGKCRVLMEKLNITTAAEFDKVFGEIIND